MIADLIHGWHEMQEALDGYEKAEDYFEGDVDEVFADHRLEAAIAHTGERYKFGLAAIPVESLADRCELQSVTAGTPDTDAVIAAISAENQLAIKWPDLILKAFEFGDSYLQVWDGPADTTDQAAWVEVALHGAKHCRVFYDEETERAKVFALKRWRVRADGGRRWRVDLYYPDVVERYIQKPGGDPLHSGTWEQYFDPDQPADEWEIPTPTGDEVPFFHFRTGLPYGKPVHCKVYGCQDAITKMLATQLTTTDSHGWPQRYSLATAGAELDNAGDDADWDDDANAADSGSVQGGTSSGQRSGPGTIQRFTGTDEVGQFNAADPAVFLDPASMYIRLMAQLSNTPLHYFDPSGGVPSGESLKVAEAPHVKRADRMKAILTATVQEFWAYALRVAGVTVTEPVTVTWVPSQSATGTSDWEAVRARQDAGVPVPVTLKEAGYAANTVDSWYLPDHPVDPEIAVLDGGAGVPFGGR